MHKCELKLHEMQLKAVDGNDDLCLDEDEDVQLTEKYLTNPFDI